MSDMDDEVPEDFDDLDLSDDSLGADFDAGEGSLGDMWRNNPLVKIGVIVGGLAMVVGAVILFGGEKEQAQTSRVGRGASVKQAPGTAPTSEAYRESIEERNIQARETAIRTGGSAIPEPIDPTVGRVKLPDKSGEEEDPLARWRRLQEERQQKMAAQPPQVQPDLPVTVEDNSAEIADALARAMAAQMESILDNMGTARPQSRTITTEEYLAQLREEEAEAAAEAAAIAAASQAQQTQVINIVLPAGSVEYGQTLIDANTDAEAPVLARIVTGPFRGSRMIGEFSEEEEYLVIRFHTAVINGLNHSIDVLALDPTTASPALVTEIDRKLFRRVILPAAASFVQGLGSGIAQSGSTSVDNGSGSTTQTTQDLDLRQEVFTGVELAAGRIADLLSEEAQDTEPMVRVEAGTPIALMFLEPVTDEHGIFYAQQ